MRHFFAFHLGRVKIDETTGKLIRETEIGSGWVVVLCVFFLLVAFLLGYLIGERR